MHKLSLAAALIAFTAAPAVAHVERPSYWPDPKPDTTVSPAAGGEVPQARSLQSAVDAFGQGDHVRIVCQGDSLQRLRSAADDAAADGYVLRPSQPRIRPSDRELDELEQIN